MPKGISNPKTKAPTTEVVEIVLRREDLTRLQRLAEEQYRTPELQAGFMLSQLLAAANTNHVAGLVNAARARKALAEQPNGQTA